MNFQRLRERSGTSLMEVLVVMVILVIGILVVLRSYPAGNASLRHAENVSIAGRLAQQQIEFWKNHAANLPEGILAVDPTTGLTDLNMLPGPPMNDKNATAFRRVVGEVVRIPVGTYFSLPGGDDVASIYVLGFSPISLAWKQDNTPANLTVSGGKMRGIQLDSDDEPDPPRWLRDRYGIDYDNAQICFRSPAVETQYVISYSYYLNGVMAPIFGQKITVQPGDGWKSLVAVDGCPAGAKIDVGSETVGRGFKYLDLGASWNPDDPYEYKLMDSTGLPNTVIGMLAFNPAGHTFQENTEQGVRALEAHITYDVLDLQIIHEDRMVPQSGPFDVKLTLRHIKQQGVTAQTDNSIYQGLGDGLVTVGGVVPDVLIVNPGTGLILDPSTYSIDYKTGTIEFPPNVVTSYDIANKNLRFYYQAENDWSVQLHKAYEHYNERSFDPSANLSCDQFMRAVSMEKVLFKPCDAEKTVAVTYKWRDNGEVRTKIGETHQISSDTLTLNVPGVDFCWIQLDMPLGNIQEIVSVVGVSVKARALWRSGQDKDRWLHVDLDSSLTRAPTEL